MIKKISLAAILLATGSISARAQVPQMINYQSRVVVGSTNFNGAGQFKFALVTGAGATLWSNDGTSSAGSEPTKAVSLTVANGLYSLLLGDATLTNMTAIPPSVFTNSDVRLRVWFNDGTNGSQVLSPDQRIAAVGYAVMAANVADGAVTSSKIASGAVGSTQIAAGAVGTTQIAAGGVSASQIADSAITAAKIGSGQVVKSINGLSDALTLAAGANISITPSGNTLTLASTGGAGLWSLNASSTYPNSIYYNNGNVGIGTNNPTFSLHIASLSGSNVRLDGGSPTILFLDTANSNAITSLRATNGGLRVLNNNNSVTIMDLEPTGFLGLGTTAPLSPLHISGTTDAIRLTATHPDITFEDSSYLTRIQSTLGGMDFKSNGAITGSNAGGIIHLDSTGTVGIGTTTPTHQLTIASNSGTPSWTSNGWLGEIALDNSSAIGWATNNAGQRFGMGHTNGGFLLFRTASDLGTHGSAATYDFVVTDTGLVGVGTNAPANKLDVRGGSITTDTSLGVGTTSLAAALDVRSAGGQSIPQGMLTQTTSGEYARLRFVSPANSGWDIAVGGANNVMNLYAGSTNKNVLSLNANGTVSVPILSVTGGSDLAEPFPMQDETVEKGSVVVIDEAHPGRLKRSTRAYDKRVAGIVSGANGINPGIALQQDGALEGGQNVALSGRVYVEADTSNGEIEAGDMLTSSDTPGHAMKATDRERAQGAVIGKAMSPLHVKEGSVLVLVTLQ